jgi:hypothetical protein
LSGRGVATEARRGHDYKEKRTGDKSDAPSRSLSFPPHADSLTEKISRSQCLCSKRMRDNRSVPNLGNQ